MDPMFIVATDGFGNISILDANRDNEVVVTFSVPEDETDYWFLTRVSNAFLELRHHANYKD